MSDQSIRMGLTGLGGYAGYMCERLIADSALPSPHVRLIAVFEPALEQFPERAAELRRLGVRLVSSYEDLLNEPIDAVCLPLPIDLHRPYTEAALRAGKAVLCEKPAAGAIEDVDAMIAARDAAGLPVAIGFQDVYQPAVHELKRRLVRGDFGVVLSASVAACWPRGDRYYKRNSWAGRFKRNGRWVLDSPASNAISHYLHLALFLLGSGIDECATPDEVEAELYRANPIENYDTCSLRLTLPGGSHALIGFTHACAKSIEPELLIRTEHATITHVPGKHITIATESVTETLPLLRNAHFEMFETLRDWIRIGPDAAPGGSLEMARAHTVTVNAASQAAPIYEIPEELIEIVSDDRGAPLRAVRGMESAIIDSVSEGRMLNESGLTTWSHPASEICSRGYCYFPGPAGARQKLQPQAG